MHYARNSRRSLLAGRGAILLVLLASPVFAAGGAESALPKTEIIPGLSEYFVPGRWIPVTVIVTGGTEDFEGRIRVEFTDRGGRRVTVTEEISVAAEARKIFRLAVRPETGALAVEFEDRDGGRLMAKDLPLRPLAPGSMAFRDETAAVLYCGGAAHPGRLLPRTEKLRLLHMRGEAIPDTWYCLEAISTLIMTDVEAERLDERQARAVARWVRSGGRFVIVTIGARALDLCDDLAELLPARVKGAVAVSEESGGIAEFVDVTGRALLEIDGRPAVVEGRVGAGRVVLCGVRLEGRSDSQELATRVFAPRIGGTAASLLDQPSLIAGSADDRMRHIPARKAFMILFAYLLLIGPLDYILLRSMGRLEWTWFTFIGMSLLATGFSLWGVYRLKTGVFSARTVRVIMAPAPGGGREVSLTDIYSQRNAAYDFTGSARISLKPILQSGAESIAGGLMADEYRVTTGERPEMRSFRVPIWTHAAVRTDAVIRPVGCRVRSGGACEVTLDDEVFEGQATVFDLSDLPDVEAALAAGRRNLYSGDDDDGVWAAGLFGQGALIPWIVGVDDTDQRLIKAALAEYRRLCGPGDGTGEGRVAVVRLEEHDRPPFRIRGENPRVIQTVYVIVPEGGV